MYSLLFQCMSITVYLFNYKHCRYFYVRYSYWKAYEVAPYCKSSGNTLWYRQTLKGCHFRKPVEKQGDKWMDLGLLGEEKRLVIVLASRLLHQYTNFMILFVASCSFAVCYKLHKKLSVSTFRVMRRK